MSIPDNIQKAMHECAMAEVRGKGKLRDEKAIAAVADLHQGKFVDRFAQQYLQNVLYFYTDKKINLESFLKQLWEYEPLLVLYYFYFRRSRIETPSTRAEAQKREELQWSLVNEEEQISNLLEKQHMGRRIYDSLIHIGQSYPLMWDGTKNLPTYNSDIRSEVFNYALIEKLNAFFAKKITPQEHSALQQQTCDQIKGEVLSANPVSSITDDKTSTPEKLKDEKDLSDLSEFDIKSSVFGKTTAPRKNKSQPTEKGVELQKYKARIEPKKESEPLPQMGLTPRREKSGSDSRKPASEERSKPVSKENIEVQDQRTSPSPAKKS